LTPKLQRVGMYGGAFDPPHLAHHVLAKSAIAQLQLDKLIVLPTGKAWHKPRPLSSAGHRVAMAHLAFADLPCVQVDARETQRAGATYTVDTLTELLQELPPSELFLIMGADQFATFGTWHRWQDIAKIATICIAARASFTWANPLNDTQNTLRSQCRIQTVDMPDTPISATDIRQRVHQGLGIDHLVNAQVARYIAQHKLYAV
jgi:nicotinate-nucleotide adenylyltransferase